MGVLKWIWYLLEIVMLIPPFTPIGIVMILSRWIFWAIKTKILIDVRFILFLFSVVQNILYLFLLALHLLLIELGGGGIKFSLHWTEDLMSNLREGVSVIENYAKEAFGFIMFWGLIVTFLFKPPLSGNIMQNIETYGFIFAVIFVPIVVGGTLLNKLNGGRLAQKAREGAQAASDKADASAQRRLQQGRRAMEKGRNAGEKMREGQERRERVARNAGRVEKGAKKAGSIIRKENGDLRLLTKSFKKAAKNLATTFPGVGKAEKKAGKKAGRSAAKKGAKYAARAGHAAESIEILPAILLIIILAPIVWGLQAAIIGGTFWWGVNLFAPMVVGPAMDAVGLGSAYGSYFGQEAANSELGVAASSGNIIPSGVRRSAAQAGARMGCMLEGPQCLREWRLNNTVRPGSEARGERYELQIEQFGLGSGESVDVAYKEANYTLPINFLVSNTRNGLKGIPARNVSYKITVRDFDTKYCTTGSEESNWTSISSFDEDGRDVILPGLGVSPTESMENLNLGDCELLQPSLGVDRVMELQVKYQYSSQATLYVDAMSRQYRREEGIEPSFKKSKTADTPVQSYINVKEPITYYETEDGTRKVVPFAARFGFDTPGFDVRYKVKPESIQIVDSSLTTNTSTCPGIQPEDRENYYKISDNAETRIELRQKNSFFNSQAEPAPLRCTMALTQGAKNRISPTGEELVMRIDANYTVVKEDRLSGFDVRNTLCTRYNCPLVVTEEYAEDSPYNLYSKCTSGNSVDARGGCSIRVPGSGNEMNWRLPNVAERNGQPIVVEQGSVARELGHFLSNTSTDTPITLSEGNKSSANTSQVNSKLSGSGVIPYGAPTSEEITRQAARSNGVIYYESDRNPGNIKIAQLDAAICKQQKVSSGSMKEALRDYMAEWNESSRGDRDPLQIVVEKRDCQDTISEFIIDSASCAINQQVNIIDATLQFYNPTDSVDSDTFDEQSCQNVAERVRECSGVLVEGRRDLQCYGGRFGSR